MLKDVPRGKARDVPAMLKAVHAQEDLAAAQEKPAIVTEKSTAMRLGSVAGCFAAGVDETLHYMNFSRGHWTRIRSNMPELIMKEIRRRTRMVSAFPDGKSALMLIAARAASHFRNQVGPPPVAGHRPPLRT